MEFDKTKVYTALNADETLLGAKGFFAESLYELKEIVANENKNDYFKVNRITDCGIDGCNFFYLVKPAPDKWYVFEHRNKTYGTSSIGYKIGDGHYPNEIVDIPFEGTKEECEQFISEHSKPKYRPFKDCDELITCFVNKHYIGVLKVPPKYTVPTILVKAKSDGRKDLITSFNDEEGSVNIDGIQNDFNELLKYYTFLDGSPCGVEE